MLRLLIAKDFRRALRNPWPWLTNLALPLAITAIIGLAFGGSGNKDSNTLARIKLAVVDEDHSFLSGALRSALTQGKASEHLEPMFVDRAEALRVLRENRISAIFIIPTNFTAKYLAGASGLKLEVIKNPAQSVMPAIVEELGAVAVSGLNAVSRNLNSEFPKVRSALTNEWGADEIVEILKRVGERLKAVRANLDPPLITYEKSVTENKAEDKGIAFSVFGYILPAMASAFLLFIADQSMRDFHREVRMKTLDRQRSAGGSAAMFIAGKIVITTLIVLFGAGILFTAGWITFRIDWGRPGLLALACVGYSVFAAGLMAALSALSPSERRIEVLNSMLIFGIAFLGGSYIPSDNFPRFMREHITPLMPNYWLIETARALQRGGSDYIAPLLAVIKLSIVGVALAIIAAIVIERRLTSGSRA